LRRDRSQKTPALVVFVTIIIVVVVVVVIAFTIIDRRSAILHGYCGCSSRGNHRNAMVPVLSHRLEIRK
jgi:hypothetical protein